MEALAGILAGSSASSVPWRCSSGVVEHDACWVLGGRGQGCSEVCGGSALVDADAFRQFGSSTRVVTSLSLHFGLSPAHHTSAFDVPCVSAADDHPAYGTAAFLYFADVDLWDCFPGESVFSIAPIFQAGCACHAPPSPPPSPPPQPPYHTMWFEAWCVAPRGMLPGLDSSCAGTAAGLLCVLLGIGLAGFCAAAAAAGQQEEPAASPGVAAAELRLAHHRLLARQLGGRLLPRPLALLPGRRTARARELRLCAHAHRRLSVDGGPRAGKVLLLAVGRRHRRPRRLRARRPQPIGQARLPRTCAAV